MVLFSFKPWEDKCALSLGVELNEDGSIIDSSIIVAPSLINVDYGLTYEQVDEMLDEGIAHAEEWQSECPRLCVYLLHIALTPLLH